ncbi:MAG: efflux RND transporter periplasmic adaptor subunit, partial [Reyranella sp.]|nr:efflux RND transporter periplasmic adaptor subunit [Reyranella sp.]
MGSAQAVEKRQRDLLALRGGALKDVAQAKSDLVAAQGDQHSAEIALGVSRNRLRILGCSEAQIAGLEKMDHIDAETIVSAPIGGTVIQRKI